MKQAVDQHDVSTGTVRWNKRFLDFADHHGVLPVASPPYWPRVKGKVERGIGYVKQCFLEGRSFTDLDDLNRQLEAWIESVANVRVHGTTGARPVDRHAEELEQLRDFATIPAYDTRPVEIRTVRSESRISVGGVFYSVHLSAVEKTVTVRAEGENVGDTFRVYLGSELVATHRRRPKGSPPVVLAEHAEAIRELTRGQAAKAYRRRSNRPQFIQLATPEQVQIVSHPHRFAPAVESRALSEYEALLGAGAA